MAGKAELVDQIKGIQRADAESKQAWWDYCEQHLGGIKDPNRHDASVLAEFINAYASATGGGYAAQPVSVAKPMGSRPQRRPAAAAPAVGASGYGFGSAYPSQQAWGGGPGASYLPGAAAAGGGASGGGSLADYIKTGQRQSAHWKSAWQAYCKMYGNGFFDPSKYEESFVVDFINYVGQLAATDLVNLAAEQGVILDEPAVGTKRPMGGKGHDIARQPPQKRMSRDRPAPAIGFGGDGEKAALVDKVKALQRADEDAKQAWWTFCDEQNGGIKDPNRHEVSMLEQFLSAYP